MPWSKFLPCTWRPESAPCVWPGRLWERPPSGWPQVWKTSVENSLMCFKKLILIQWNQDFLIPTWISWQDELVRLEVRLVTGQRDVREDSIATEWLHGAEEDGVVLVPLHLVVVGHFRRSDRRRGQEVIHRNELTVGFEKKEIGITPPTSRLKKQQSQSFSPNPAPPVTHRFKGAKIDSKYCTRLA